VSPDEASPTPGRGVPDAPTTLTSEKIYTVGSLRYTRGGLITLYLWLLGGDFAFVFFESIFGRFIPIYLKDMNASNTLIGIATGSLAGLMNILFLPNISMASDRYRGRWGRRIPFIIWSLPLAVGSLILVGLAPEIAALMHRAFGRWLPMDEQTLTLALLTCFVITYHLFNMVLVNAYNWLLREVVPQELMGRFLSWFRVMSSVALFAFLWCVFPLLISHRITVFISIGLAYSAIFLLMCWRVKEGTYPPPANDDRPGVIKSFLLYFRECLSIPIYRDFFIAYVLVTIASGSASSFGMLFVRNTLGLSMGEIGHFSAWTAIVTAVIYIPMGWLCDKFNPLRVAVTGLVLYVVFLAGAYWLVQDGPTWFVFTLLTSMPAVMWGLGSYTIGMKLFPSEKFAQFNAGLSVFSMGGLIFGNYIMGVFMDWNGSNYRLNYAWMSFFCVLAIAWMIPVYRGWLRHGGPDNYVPPLDKDDDSPFPQRG